MRAYGAEFLGTFWLVLGAAAAPCSRRRSPQLGIGLHGVSLAFGLTVLTMAYAIGHISGGHLNPAVSIGLWAGGRFPAAKTSRPTSWRRCSVRSSPRAVLYLIASGTAGFDHRQQPASRSNGYGDIHAGRLQLLAALVCEVVLTAMFL